MEGFHGFTTGEDDRFSVLIVRRRSCPACLDSLDRFYKWNHAAVICAGGVAREKGWGTAGHGDRRIHADTRRARRVVCGGHHQLKSYPLLEVVTLNGVPEQASASGYETLRRRADILRAALGEAIHRIQRGHPEEVEGILESAVSAYDRGFE